MHTNIYKLNPDRDSRKSGYFKEKIKKIAVTQTQTHTHTHKSCCVSKNYQFVFSNLQL
jgi:hypothetical protein